MAKDIVVKTTSAIWPMDMIKVVNCQGKEVNFVITDTSVNHKEGKISITGLMINEDNMVVVTNMPVTYIYGWNDEVKWVGQMKSMTFDVNGKEKRVKVYE